MHGEQRHPLFEWVVLGFGGFVVGEQIGDAGLIQGLCYPCAGPGGAAHYDDVPQIAAVVGDKLSRKKAICSLYVVV